MDVSGRRIVEVQCSSETVDLDGDVVLQSALMGSANSFVERGHFDIDHLSEFGARMGISNPSSYIIGRPLEVTAESGGRTFVRGEISRSSDGKFDPVRNRFDEFWDSLQRDPPVMWFSSIYGFPVDLDDCKAGVCTSGATRYVIKSIDWRSLAFTRQPKNTGLTSPTRVVSAKSYMLELSKSMGLGVSGDMPPQPNSLYTPPTVPMLGSMNDVWTNKSCAGCNADDYPSLIGYRHHFAKCLGCSPGMADIAAHGVMFRYEMQRRYPGMNG